MLAVEGSLEGWDSGAFVGPLGRRGRSRLFGKACGRGCNSLPAGGFVDRFFFPCALQARPRSEKRERERGAALRGENFGNGGDIDKGRGGAIPTLFLLGVVGEVLDLSVCQNGRRKGGSGSQYHTKHFPNYHLIISHFAFFHFSFLFFSFLFFFFMTQKNYRPRQERMVI